jgi:hypothetical protein
VQTHRLPFNGCRIAPQGANGTPVINPASEEQIGAVRITHPAEGPTAPFGGYEQSGNGREHADCGIIEFVEIKGIVGYASKAA